MADPIDRAQLEAFRDDAQEIISEWEAICLRATSLPVAQVFNALMRCSHNLKGNAGLMGFESMAQAMHRVEDRLMHLAADKLMHVDPVLLGILLETEKFIRNWIEKVVEQPNYQPENLNVISKLEAWTRGAQVEVGPNAQPVAAALEQGGFGSESVRIASAKLDQLIQLVGELILAQAIVSRGRTDETLETPLVKDAVGLCDKLVHSLRLTVLDMRMLPMSVLYAKLERAAMEVSITLKKPIHLLFDGHEVSVDRAVLNRIFDPLLHILRNGIDHGLELPSDRARLGKKAVGTIVISSTIEPSGVCIRICDDGRGLSVDRIRIKGVERGLIKADEECSDERIFNLIFEPGFSTAEKLTSISGRGIGLDIVKKEVINLGGQVDMTSQPGSGTEFTIRLPVSISLIDVLVANNSGQVYCVPTQDIVEVLDANDISIESSARFSKMARHRDRVLPIESVDYFLKPTGKATEGSTLPGYILVVNYQDQLLGIRVDSVTHQQQVFVRPLRGYLADLPCLTGSTILSSGEPSLIVNVKQMANTYFMQMYRRDEHAEHRL